MIPYANEYYSQNGVPQSESKNAPSHQPFAVLNGYLTRSRNRANPSTDIDHSPIEFRHYVNASGFHDVQLNNGLNRRIGTGLRVPFVNYLYAAVPQIPGQRRDNWGGQHKHGIGPIQYQNVWQQGPGSQPQDQGGTRQMMGDYMFNPGTS